MPELEFRTMIIRILAGVEKSIEDTRESLSVEIKPEKTLNSQNNVEKGSQNWRHPNSRLQAVLQSCNHQDSMVLAQKQMLRSMEQNREPRNCPTNGWPTNL